MTSKKKSKVTKSSTVIWCDGEEVSVCRDRGDLQEAVESCQESWRGVVAARRGGAELERRQRRTEEKR